jgi:hypothetical protein
VGFRRRGGSVERRVRQQTGMNRGEGGKGAKRQQEREGRGGKKERGQRWKSMLILCAPICKKKRPGRNPMHSGLLKDENPAKS